MYPIYHFYIKYKYKAYILYSFIQLLFSLNFKVFKSHIFIFVFFKNLIADIDGKTIMSYI